MRGAANSGSRLAWLPVFFLSGAAGLGYQTVWTKMFANGLGQEVPAMLAIVCTFMAGMALGAWATAKSIAQQATPAIWYAGLELMIGAWGFVSCWIIPLINGAMVRVLGPSPSPTLHWIAAFGVVLVGLLPATAAMGATFAAMERLLAMCSAQGRAVGAVYASNTFGAVAGILASTFLLMPQLGLRATAMSLAGINVLCALLAWRLGVLSIPGEFQGVSAIPNRKLKLELQPRRLWVTMFGTGVLGIGLELVGIRVLSQVMENTVFTFAAVTAIYLLGTAFGAAGYQRFARAASDRSTLWYLLWTASVVCLGSIFLLSKAEMTYNFLLDTFGESFGGGIAAELLCAGSVFLLPTVAFGALFSHLFQTAKHSGIQVGSGYALNCLGSAVAPVIFPLALLPVAEAKITLVVIALAYLTLLPKFKLMAVVPLGLAGTLALPTELQFVEGKVVAYCEGRMASVAVVEDAVKERTLRVNNRFQMGGTSAHQAEYRQAHFPLLLHPDPRHALFLGAGTGITMAAAKLYPNAEVEGVELVPEVVEVMQHFRPYNNGVEPAEVLVADARRFVRATSRKYDVIVGDLFHPALDGAGTLYTREHFSAIRARLSATGLFCQWLPLHQLDEPMLRLVIRTFLDVFPNAQAYLLHYNVEVPVLGLVGFVATPKFSEEWIESRNVPSEIKALTLTDSLRFFGHFVGGPEFLRGYAGTGPINTDDQQLLTFGAPTFSFRRNTSSHGRLWRFLLADADELGVFGERLTRYVHARNTYLLGLAQEDEARAINAFVESAKLSEDFTAGYAQCLSKASLWMRENPEKAKALLERLVDAQPSRTIAREMLERIK